MLRKLDHPIQTHVNPACKTHLGLYASVILKICTGDRISVKTRNNDFALSPQVVDAYSPHFLYLWKQKTAESLHSCSTPRPTSIKQNPHRLIITKLIVYFNIHEAYSIKVPLSSSI